MAKHREGEKRAQLCFIRPEDLRLYSFLEKRSYEARYDVGTFIMVSLHEAFKGQVEEEEVNALAEEAARKVRDRTTAIVPATMNFPDPDFAPSTKPVSLSMDQAQKQAEAQIAALDNLATTAMKKHVARKGVPQPPEMPKEK